MTYRALELNYDRSAVEGLGVDVEESDEGVRFSASVGQQAVVVYGDVAARSVTVVWRNGELQIARVEREGATQLHIEDGGPVIRFVVQQETDDLAGELVVEVGDHISVRDHLLFR